MDVHKGFEIDPDQIPWLPEGAMITASASLGMAFLAFPPSRLASLILNL